MLTFYVCRRKSVSKLVPGMDSSLPRSRGLAKPRAPGNPETIGTAGGVMGPNLPGLHVPPSEGAVAGQVEGVGSGTPGVSII